MDGAAGGQAQGAASAPRCRHRSADRRFASVACHRPRDRFPAGDHAADDRRHPLRRLGSTPGLDLVHPVESISRGAGNDTGLPEESEQIARHLCALLSHGSDITTGYGFGCVGRARTFDFNSDNSRLIRGCRDNEHSYDFHAKWSGGAAQRVHSF